MKSLFCFSEAIAPFGQTIHPISTSPPLAQINVCLTQVLLAARWEAPKEQFKNITSILFGHRGGKNHKKKSFNPGSRVCPDVRMEAWTLTSLVGWRSKSHPPKKIPQNCRRPNCTPLSHLSMGAVNESRIRATSAAHKCPYSLLYHSGKRPLIRQRKRGGC